MSQFDGNDREIIAQTNSPFYFYLGCGAYTGDGTALPVSGSCVGTFDQYVTFFFGGLFTKQNFWLDVGVLLGYMTLARALTWFSLKKFNYTNT
jgi:hypothetical protein